MWIFRGYFEDPRFVRQLVLRQEFDFPIPDTKTVLLKIDTRLIRFEHVQSEEEVDIAALSTTLVSITLDGFEQMQTHLHDRIRAAQVKISYLHRCAVNSPKNLRGADTASDPRETGI
jgi:hypothetical protein